MPITVFKQAENPERFSLAPLEGRRVAVIGYGNQGRAQSLCLRDSGVAVIIGARNDSRGIATARTDGFDAMPIGEAAACADLAIIALPDEVHGAMFEQELNRALPHAATVGFLHAFSIRFQTVHLRDDLGIVLLAPKGPGLTLRRLYLEGRGLPALYAMERNSARGDAEPLAFAWAGAIGAGRSGVIHTTFASEAETDLFGEQAVLCGGMLYLMLAAFETLVGAGYEPELAYLECAHELKQVADLLYARGPDGMANAISTTAEFGALRSGPAIVTEQTRHAMQRALESIRSGEFARALAADAERSFEWFREEQARLERHPIVKAGKAVRSLMPWLEEA